MVTVNGTSYGAWDDVPPQLRNLIAGHLPDADGDGVPDFLQSLGLPTGTVAPPGAVTTTIDIDEQTYDSMTALPDEIRARVLEALRAPLHAGAQSAGVAGPAGSPPSGSVPTAPSPDGPPRPHATPATTTPASAPRPGAAAPGEMILNGERVSTASATTPGLVGGTPRRSWLGRLLGRG